jgi:hypothetical protein
MKIRIPLIVLTIFMAASILAAQTAKTAPQAEPGPAAPVQSPWPSTIVFVRYGSFSPSEKIFKTVYGSGSIYSGELRLHVKSGFYLSLEGGYFKKTGKLTATQEPTTMTIFPIDAMVVFKPLSGHVMPYAGVGGAMCKYTEKNVIGEVNEWGYGFAIFGGVTTRWRSIGIDARVKYGSVKVKPLENDINLGGLTFSIAAGYIF